MRRKVLGWIVVGAGLLLAMGIMAWTSGPVRAAKSGPDHLRRVVFAPTATPAAAGNRLFREGFATYSNRWQLQESPKASVTIDEWALHIQVSSPGVSIWSVPDFDLELEHYSAQVAVDFRDGAPDSAFGFVLRYEDDEHFYALVFTPEGAWHVLHRTGAVWADVTPPDAASFERESDDPVIWLRVDVRGNTLAFFVDGQPVGEATVEDDLAEGVFGLIAQAGKGFIDVTFDDMLVTGISEATQP